MNALHRWRRFKLIYGDGTNGWRFEAAIMAIIIANVVTLAMYDPTTAVDVGRNAALQVRICRFFNYLEWDLLKLLVDGGNPRLPFLFFIARLAFGQI